ncbi:MAG: NAD(P)H-dependent glycerol-3-phosphate dehydrogenase [Burkholderiaceae bacterium]
MRCTVLGAGAWGTALACHLARQHDVMLWARRADLVTQIRAASENEQYLPGVALQPDISITDQFDEALTFAGDDGLIVLATPIAALGQTLDLMAGRVAQGGTLSALVGVSKGIDTYTGLLPHQLSEQHLGEHPFAVLSGPSFALEVGKGLPCALVAASTDAALGDRVQSVFHHSAMRIYLSEDLLGVELAGALKNVMALAAGIADGLQLGDNARAALVTRGLAEMTRLGVALGAQPATFMGLAGLGDLMLTCAGGLSRNRRVGLLLAKGEPIKSITESLGHVAEGVPCCAAALALAQAKGVEMPIANAVQAVIDQRQLPGDAVSQLLARDPANEQQ